MAKADIEITLNGKSGEEQADLYHPGDTIYGTVTAFPDADVSCKHFYIRLLWHTEGRGTRYLEKVEEMDVFQGELRNGMPRSFDFAFRLPPEPWSFNGYYVSVVWKIQAQIDVSWAKDPKNAVRFRLRPSPVAEEAW